MELIAALWTVAMCSIILSQLLRTNICSPSDENFFDDFVLLRALQMYSTEDAFTVRTMCNPCFEDFILHILEDHL